MSHPFGDLLTQYRARKHGLSQAKLAEAVGYDHAVIVRMCQGRKDLTGPSGRDRVVRIIGALRDFGVLSTLDEANALLGAANLPPLYTGQAAEAALIQSLDGRGAAHSGQSTQRISSLPTPPTALIGREADVAAAKQLLLHDHVRLLTLLGSPGVGKTRLAIQVATELNDAFEGDVCFVALAPISDASFVIPTIAQTLGVIQVSSQPLIESVKVALRNRRLLLVLDNFEHILGEAEEPALSLSKGSSAAPSLAELLASAPQLKVLATSRAALHISAEREFHVSPLALPDPNHLPPLDALADYAAVALFVERAESVAPDFALTEANAPAVAAICRRLDGLPLAIELAAARLKLFNPETLLARLEKAPLEMLTGGASDLPPRQRMLRSTIDWSYNLLKAHEQAVFRRLGVFAGGFTLEAAEAVTGAQWSAISSLLDKSLIQRSHALSNGVHSDEARFTLLEMLREYAVEKLAENGEADEIRRRHAEYFVGLAEAAEPKLLTGEQIVWLIRLNNEHDNLRAVLRWAQEAQDYGEIEATLRIIGATWRYWQTGNHVGEGRLWLYPALSTDALVPAHVRAKAYHAAGALALYQGDMPEGCRLHEQGVIWAKAAQDDYLIGLTLNGFAAANRKAGDFARAKPIAEWALAHTCKDRQSWNYAGALVQGAGIARRQGDYKRAISLNGEAKVLLLELGDRIWAIVPLLFMGIDAQSAGDDDQAERYFTEGLMIAKELGTEFAEYGNVCTHLSGLSELAALQRRPLRMARLRSAVEALAERVGGVDRGIIPLIDQRIAITQYTETMGESVDEHAFAAAWAEGRTMTLEQAIDYALSEED